MKNTILVAGGTGNLGERVIHSLLRKGAAVRTTVRSHSNQNKVNSLKKLGVKVYEIDLFKQEEVVEACTGVSCVISTLAGLREVIIDAQRNLLDAAITAGVKRFIPSDFSLDFTKLNNGENRNLDLRREFHKYLDDKSIQATTIFNGAFMELITDEMPLILFKFNRIFYWGNADQQMDFTTMDDTAEFTANAALDTKTPRYLRIAGDQLSAKEMAAVVGEVYEKSFRLFRPGGLGMLQTLIKITRTIAPGEQELYPAWQGMQYMHNMLDGRGKLKDLDNDRYPNMSWTNVKMMLKEYKQEQEINRS